MLLNKLTEKLTLYNRRDWLKFLLSITNIYLSLVSQDIPEFFVDNLRPWMDGFLGLLRLHLPGVDNDDCEANSLDKLKHAICDIATLFSQRYEVCFADYTEGFVAGTWELLTMTDQRTRLVVWLDGGVMCVHCIGSLFRFDSLVHAALGFLSAICQRPHYIGYFEGEGVLKTICESVIVQNLLLREEDTDMYEQEPLDYLKRDIEGESAWWNLASVMLYDSPNFRF